MHRSAMIPDWFIKTCFRQGIHLILCLVFAGCSSMPKVDVDDSSIRLKGKMLVSDGDTKKILRYRFEGNSENGSATFWSLIGFTPFEFRIIDSRLYYLEQKTQVPILYSKESMQKDLGFDLPFELGWYWILGMPEPNRDFRVIDRSESGEIVAFEQLGWIIRQEPSRGHNNELKGKAKKLRIAQGKTQLLVTVEPSR